jgi:hypothetical protein
VREALLDVLLEIPGDETRIVVHTPRGRARDAAAVALFARARERVSLIAVKEPGMIGVMEPVSGAGNGHPGRG